MKYLEVEIPEDCGYLVPIACPHFGDKAFKGNGEKKLREMMEWIMERPNAYTFLLGDIYNVASRISKTSPFESDTDEYEEAIDFFKPYADKIIGVIDGNHESRMSEMFGASPLQFFCRELKIPYCKYSAVVKFKVGKRTDAKSKNRYNEIYNVYFHHTTGGGGTIGGKLNRVTKLRDIVEGVDVYVGGHTHQISAAPQNVYYPTRNGIKKRRIWYVGAGSYLEYNDSYAEKKMLAPAKTGSPRIRLDGRSHHHDVHVSL